MKSNQTLVPGILLGIISLVLVACSSSDDSTSAVIMPAVNPAFSTVSSVTMSDLPTGNFSVVEYQYDNASEKITLAKDAIAAGGNYLKITGEATVNDSTDTYTVMTFVKDNKTIIAAHELTTLAVAMVANDANISSFDDAIEVLEANTGLSNMDLTMAMTEVQRDDLPNLQAAMHELSKHFKGSDLDLTALTSVSAPNIDMVAWGALIYDNWMTAPSEMPSATSGGGMDHTHMHMKPAARASGHDDGSMDLMPTNLMPMLSDGTNTFHMLDSDGEEFEMFSRFARCKECHGWDQMGNNGSHKNRSRGQKTLKNPNDDSDTGQFVKRPKSIEGTDLTVNTMAYSMMDIEMSTGIKYANVDSQLTAGTVAELVTSWNNAVNETDGSGVRLSDKHPDFTRTTAADAADSVNPNEGAVNELVPSHEQIMALVAFLNFDGGKPDHVMTFDADSGQYVLNEDDEHAISHGQMYYANYCFRCHGAPNNTDPNNPLGAYTNLMGYLSNDDGSLNPVRFSSVFHVARWGKSGKVMTRDRIGYPDAHDVGAVLAYLKHYQAGDADLLAATASGNTGMGDAETGEVFYYAKCAGCHAASTAELTASDETDTDSSGEDNSYRCHDHDTGDVVTVGSDGTCGDNHTIPNLAHTHFRMTSDLSSISDVMTNVNNGVPLTQQEINDLAAFFTSLGSHAGE